MQLSAKNHAPVTVTDTSTVDLTITSAQALTADVIEGGVDHNSLANLTTGDPHTQYALLAGRSGGQELIGGTGTSEDLTLSTNPFGNGTLLILANNAEIQDDGSPSFRIRSASNLLVPAPQFNTLRAKGTLASPEIVTDGMRLGSFVFQGHNGIGYTIGATLAVAAAEDWSEVSGANRGAKVEFIVRDTGSASDTTILTLEDGVATISELALTTDLALTHGGTGASLVDPGADRIMAWDDTAGTVAFIALANINTEAAPAAGDFLLAYTAEGALVKIDWDDLTADHGSLGGLGDDDHTQYALLAGRSGGQIITGGTGSGDDLTLRATSNATKGSIVIDDALKLTTQTITDDATLDEDDNIVFCNNTTNKTVTLPAASGNTGLTYYIKKVNSGTATVTIDGNASETIDGATTLVLYVQYDAVRIVCDGSNWFVISDELIPHQAKMTRDNAQTILASGSIDKIDFDNTDYDIGGIADSTTNDRFDIRRTGKYTIAASWYANLGTADLFVDVWIYVNGVAVELNRNSCASTGDAGVGHSVVRDLTAGDNVEFHVAQARGTTYDTTTAEWAKPSMEVSEIR